MNGPAPTESLPLGVVVERRAVDHPWCRWRWQAVAVLPGAPAEGLPRVLREGEGWCQIHAATLDLVLHRTDTDGYRLNLASANPAVFVVLRDEGDEAPVPAVVTVCPHEAQDYLDAGDGDETVEALAMPEAVRAWVAAFVDRFHVEVPFVKRQRRRWAASAPVARPPNLRNRS